MRHTALTRMAPFCDPFTLARIAGHSSITITQRYCHPQADSIEAAFSKFGNREGMVIEAGNSQQQAAPDGAGLKRLDAATEVTPVGGQVISGSLV